MYAVKVFHGYITYTGNRTRKKEEARTFNNEQTALKFAYKIGGRVKRID